MNANIGIFMKFSDKILEGFDGYLETHERC